MGRKKVSLYPLPPLIPFEEYKGNWKLYQEALYKIFQDSISNKLTFLSLPVRCRYFPSVEGMHQCFWHLMTESPKYSKKDEDREVDFRRCERISWIPHILINYSNPQIICWERDYDKNTVLWLKQDFYMIVLSKRKNYYLLKTAYCHHSSKVKSNSKDMMKYRDPRKT